MRRSCHEIHPNPWIWKVTFNDTQNIHQSHANRNKTSDLEIAGRGTGPQAEALSKALVDSNHG
jgi:hypothetical protein